MLLLLLSTSECHPRIFQFKMRSCQQTTISSQVGPLDMIWPVGLGPVNQCGQIYIVPHSTHYVPLAARSSQTVGSNIKNPPEIKNTQAFGVRNIWFLCPLVPSKREKNIQTETNQLSQFVYFSLFLREREEEQKQIFLTKVAYMVAKTLV